jgi:hypothetical protein
MYLALQISRLLNLQKIVIYKDLANHVKWVHCRHSMVCPRVADRGDGLQIWRVATNILNKQSRTADSGWSSSLGVGLTTLGRPKCRWEDGIRIDLRATGLGGVDWI